MQFLYIDEMANVRIVSHEGESTLATLQTLVEGYIELVRPNPADLGFDGDMWANEEGLYNPDFAVNPLASLLAGTRIVGPVVITRSDDMGNTVGLTDADLEAVRERMLVDGDLIKPEHAVALRANWVEQAVRA